MKKKDFKFPVSMGFVIEFAKDENGKTIFVLRTTGGNIARFATDKKEFLLIVDTFIDTLLSANIDGNEG